MPRIELRATGLFPLPGLSSIGAIQTTFEHASGSIGARAEYKSFFSSAEDYIRTISVRSKPSVYHTLLWKLRRLGPVWAMPGCGIPDTALVDIDLVQEKIAELDGYLIDTLFLRSTPLASLLLPEIAALDNAVYLKLIDALVSTTHKHAPAVASIVVEELQIAQQQMPTAASHQSKPLFRRLASSTTLTNRRGVNDLMLDNLPALGAGVQQHDLILLAHRILEDPDFPVAPFWHEEYATQRSWLDTALQLSEDSGSGFFTHEIFLKKVLQELNGAGVFPHPGKLRTLQSSAVTEVRKIMKAEAETANNEESKRLLRFKIEHLIPEVASNEEQLKALRLVQLKMLGAEDVLKLSDRNVVSQLKAGMQKIMNDEDHVPDLNEDCICDIISEYSEDLDEHYWNEQSVLDVVCNERKRQLIFDWILSSEDPKVVHSELCIEEHHYCGPLEAIDDQEDTIKEEIKLKTHEEGTYDFPKIIFNRDEDGNIVLPLDDGYAPERSAGHYTNMSGLSGLSSAYCKSSSYEDEVKELRNFHQSDSSIEDDDSTQKKQIETKDSSREHDEVDSEHGCIVHPGNYPSQDIFSCDPLIKNRSFAGFTNYISYRASSPTKNDTEDPYAEKRIAITRRDNLNARRLNTLHMAWDIPHHSHGPQPPGFRPYHHGCYGHTRPSPDWDAPSAEKPRFAQRQERAGALTLFNMEFEAKLKAMHGSKLDETLVESAFVPPRRPRHEHLMTAFYGTPPTYDAVPVQVSSFVPQQHSTYETGSMDAAA